MPEGAFDKGVTVKLERYVPREDEQLPPVPAGHFAAGLRITSEQKLAWRPLLAHDGALLGTLSRVFEETV